jgi:hypothetical protein
MLLTNSSDGKNVIQASLQIKKYMSVETLPKLEEPEKTREEAFRDKIFLSKLDTMVKMIYQYQENKKKQEIRQAMKEKIKKYAELSKSLNKSSIAVGRPRTKNSSAVVSPEKL